MYNNYSTDITTSKQFLKLTPINKLHTKLPSQTILCIFLKLNWKINKKSNNIDFYLLKTKLQ